MRWSIQLFRCPALLNHRRIVSWDGTLVCVMADFKIETRLWLVYLNRTCVHILSNSLVHQLSPLSLFSTMAHSNMFVLPDIISFCQAPKPVSPHYEQVAAEAKQGSLMASTSRGRLSRTCSLQTLGYWFAPRTQVLVWQSSVHAPTLSTCVTRWTTSLRRWIIT